MRSRLGIAKGLGSSHHGVQHFWLQRVTAVALIPLTLWFITSLITTVVSSDIIYVAQWFASPINAILTVLLLIALFMHARLGVQVVIEDYISCKVKRYSLLIANNLVSIGLSVISIFAVLKLHLLDVVASSL